jgi:hypothetical protein
LFLDEIGDFPLASQALLLRVLQEGEIVRVGDATPRRINVRILSATQYHLEDRVAAGRFRADLLYRLRVARIQLPALRERRKDIPILANTLLSEFRAAFDKPVCEVGADAMQRLLEHDWPGNVRELRSAIEYAMLHSRGRQIGVQDLPPELRQNPAPRPLIDHQEVEKQELLLVLARAVAIAARPPACLVSANPPCIAVWPSTGLRARFDRACRGKFDPLFVPLVPLCYSCVWCMLSLHGPAAEVSSNGTIHSLSDVPDQLPKFGWPAHGGK